MPVPLAYQIDRPQGLVTITGECFSPDGWVALFNAIVQDSRFRPGLNFIRDLRGPAPQMNVDTLNRIIEIAREFWDRLGIRRAALLTEDVIEKVALALAVQRSLPFRVFTSQDEALAWLREGQGRGKPLD